MVYSSAKGVEYILTDCSDCSKLQKENALLKERLALVEFELRDLRSKFFKRSKKKDLPKQDPPPPSSKKKGGLFGHIG